MELSSLASGAAPTVDVVSLPRRVEPLAPVRRDLAGEGDEPAIAPRRDSASFSPEALARLAAERG